MRGSVRDCRGGEEGEGGSRGEEVERDRRGGEGQAVICEEDQKISFCIH